MIKRFWQNLGISYQEIQTLPQCTIETLSEIMMIEEQYNDRETKKTYGKNNIN
jgi:hypothetical protein